MLLTLNQPNTIWFCFFFILKCHFPFCSVPCFLHLFFGWGPPHVVHWSLFCIQKSERLRVFLKMVAPLVDDNGHPGAIGPGHDVENDSGEMSRDIPLEGDILRTPRGDQEER